MSNKRGTRVVIPCRLGYLNCWRAVSHYGGNAKYSVSAIIPKSDVETIEMINKAIDTVKESSIQKWGGRIPSNLRNPLHDGDEEKPDNPVYHNCFYINAKSKEAPQIVDAHIEPITDQTEVYSGCYGRVSITFFAYNYNGNRGIAAALGNIQKLNDGEPLGGQVSAKDDFGYAGDDFLN